MNNKLQVSYDKTLKLNNALIKTLDQIEFADFSKEVLKMENYIRTKGSMPVGPLVQHTNSYVDEKGQIKIKVSLILQSTNFIHNIESQYKMEATKRIKNCLYVRYTGEEGKLKLAYDKLNLLAYEENIGLKGDSYTIFLEQDDENIVADVFMEKAMTD